MNSTRNLVVTVLLFCAGSLGQQAAAPPLLYPAFRNSKVILTGTVTAVDASQHLVMLQVMEQLRGRSVGASVEVPYNAEAPNPKRPPSPWDRIAPGIGKRMMVF